MSNGTACNQNLAFKAKQLSCSDIIQDKKIDLVLIVAEKNFYISLSFEEKQQSEA